MTLKLLKLFRLPLAGMNGVTAVAGYLLFPDRHDARVVAALFLGVSLLAAAASALNQVAERDLDALMRRTCDRPLPKGDLRPETAAALGVATALPAVLLLWAGGGRLAACLGLAAVLWYLTLYTPLKRRTPFALLIGSLCGSAAPVIGWSAAGGALGDFRIVLLAGIVYLWQVPHFWMLQRRNAEDYRRAGFPVFAPTAGTDSLEPVCRLWIAATLAVALMLPAFGITASHPYLSCLALSAPLLVSCFTSYDKLAFAGLNAFPVFLTLALFAGK